MLKAAFNMILKMNSREAQLKRMLNPVIYSPCRIAHSNYFRFLRGPENTTIHGREFVIALDTLLGQFAQSIVFSAVPASGNFQLRYNGNDSAVLAFNETAAAIQVQLRLVAGLANVIVTGDFTSGFIVTFPGFATSPLALTVVNSTLQTAAPVAVTQVISQTYAVWPDRIKKGDKLVDNVYNSLTIEEVIEMTDIGGAVMGFRVRCE